MPSQSVTLADWKGVLRKYGGPSAAAVADNPKLAAATFDVLKDIAESNYGDAGVDAVGLAGEAIQNRVTSPRKKAAMRALGFTVSEVKLTMSLRVLMGTAEAGRAVSPGGALTLIGATMVTKTGLALELAGDDQDTARCVGALLEVAGNVGVTLVTGVSGIGGVLGLASVAASSWSAYDECRGPKRSKSRGPN